jgi:hypothetical protein
LLLDRKADLKRLKLNSTSKTPEIDLNPSSGVFNITGISVPEDSISFYEPILSWLEDYLRNPAKSTTVTVKLAYVNTSSLQTLYDLLSKIDKIDKSQSNVKVNWFHLREDEDMKDVGEDLQEALNLKFDFTVVDGL